MPDLLPADPAAVMRAKRQVHAIRKRVMAECRRARHLVELVCAARVMTRSSARWQFGRSKFA
jgi:hypothetical protein